MKTKKLIGLLLAVIMCLGVVTPFSVFADTTDTQSATEPEIIWKEDFTNAQKTGTINKDGDDTVISKNNGIFVATQDTDTDKDGYITTYDFSDGTLNYLTKDSGDYMDVRFKAGTVMERDLRQDFIFSFRLYPMAPGFSAQFSWSSSVEKSGAENINENALYINAGRFYHGKTAADTTAVIPANVWSLIEIAFHYNEEATPDSATARDAKGAIDSYSVLLNGEELYTASTNKKIQNIDFFRMLQWTGDNVRYAVDDIRVALGNTSLISVSPAYPPMVYHEDFDTLTSISYDGSTDGIGSKNGLWAGCKHYYISNGSLNYDKAACSETDPMFDMRFESSTHGMIRDLTQDFVFSFKIKPSTSTFGTQFSWKDSDTDAGSEINLFKIADGAICLAGNKTNGKLPANEWSLVEIVFNYDETANKIGSISAMLNGNPVYYGNKVYEATANKAILNVSFFRIFTYPNAAVSFDDFSITLGTSSLYGYYNKGTGETYFEDGFSSLTNIPTDPAKYGSNVCDGYRTGGSTVENGVMTLSNGTTANGLYDLQLYNQTYSGSHNLITGDATLSMRIMPGENFGSTENFMSFAKHSAGAFHHAMSFRNGTVYVSSMSNGDIYKDVIASKTLSTTEFNTIELMFNYDYGKMCYTSVDSYVNGEYLGTTKISDETLKGIDHFRTLRVWSANMTVAVDSVKIFEGHKSLHVAKTDYVGYQATAANDNKFNLRLVGVMTEADYESYEKVGFNVKATYGSVVMEKKQDITSVYEKIIATAGSDYIEYTAEQLGGEYIFALNCLNIPSNAGVITFEVTTYYQIKGCEEFEEMTYTFTVDPTTDDIPQASVNN